MQINNNFNRFSSPQFGMALKVNKGAQEYLQRQSMNTLEKIAQAGKDMADFKFWDLEVNSTGLRIKSKRYANAYINPKVDLSRNPKEYKSFTDFSVHTTYDGNGVTGPKGKTYPLTFMMDSNEEAVKAYEKFAQLDDVDKSIELTKMLEERDAKDQAAAIAKDKAKAEKNSFIDNLFEKFGNMQAEI